MQDIFLTKKAKENRSAKYSLQLYINGIRRVVEVDDYLPFDTKQNKVAFAHSKI